MPLNAGFMDTPITLQARAAGVDARGQPNGAWGSLATDASVWAQPMPAKGREYFAAGQLQAEGAMAWRIRYRTDLTAAMRVLEGATPYDIVAVVPSANREWVDLYCTQGVKDGR
jgi:SPP1 family predicted phage head-tail adaptor